MFPTRRGEEVYLIHFLMIFTENTILRTDLIEQERDYLFKVDLPELIKKILK